MRTKTLLIAAAALAVGVVASQAQTVYSQNIVGYVNSTVAAGYNLFTAPVSPDGTNSAEACLPSLTSGDQVLVWTGGGYAIDYFNGPSDWYDGVTFNPIPEPNLPSGSAFFYQNNTGSTKTNTFVGTCVLSNTVALAAGYTLVGSTAPIGTNIENSVYGIPFTSGDQVLVWTGGGYAIDYYNGPNDWYDGVSFNAISQPTISVGQGFFYQNNTGSSVNWQQNVTIP